MSLQQLNDRQDSPFLTTLLRLNEAQLKISKTLAMPWALGVHWPFSKFVCNVPVIAQKFQTPTSTQFLDELAIAPRMVALWQNVI